MITIEQTVHAPIEKVWDFWSSPEHIVRWNAASDDWHTTKASNDLMVGRNFTNRMEAKDGSMGFDISGTYTEVEHLKKITYVMNDGRTVRIEFFAEDGGVRIVEVFEAESENSLEMQQTGWQAILDNFKKYVESS